MKTARIKIQTRTASGNRRGWHKLVTGIDRSKVGGYAFLGDFIRDGLHDVDEGALILECFPTGSAKSNRKSAVLWKAAGIEPASEDSNRRIYGVEMVKGVDDWPAEALLLVDAAEGQFKKSTGVNQEGP